MCNELPLCVNVHLGIIQCVCWVYFSSFFLPVCCNTPVIYYLTYFLSLCLSFVSTFQRIETYLLINSSGFFIEIFSFISRWASYLFNFVFSLFSSLMFFFFTFFCLVPFSLSLNTSGAVLLLELTCVTLTSKNCHNSSWPETSHLYV